jgi:riboflavin biosynthesis pyrimidine reductase
MSKYEFDLILDGIKTMIAQAPCSDEELVDGLKRNPERVIRVIRYLLDNGKITRNMSGQLVWHSK